MYLSSPPPSTSAHTNELVNIVTLLISPSRNFFIVITPKIIAIKSAFRGNTKLEVGFLQLIHKRYRNTIQKGLLTDTNG